MSKRVLELFLLDIYIAICKIQIVVANFENDEELLNDFVSWDSVIREFEIVGEATKILIQNSYLSEEFRRVVDFRNLISHHYFGIDSEAVWSIITKHLPAFKSDIIRVIDNVDRELQVELVQSAIEDNRNYKQVVEMLKEIKIGEK